MAQTPGTPSRPNTPNTSGVPQSARTRDPSVRPVDFTGYGIDRVIQDSTPATEDSAYEQCFAGPDYTITAVIPYEHRFTKNVRTLEGALEAFQANEPTPGQSVPVDELRARAESRQVLMQALNTGKQQTSGQAFYKTFAEMQTISITSRRSVEPVRRLGEVSPVEYLKGPRTFAGSMIFTMLQEDVLMDLYRVAEADSVDTEPFFVSDRLPPFNILIQGSNEAGHMVESAIFGVELIASGMTLSIDDLYTEQTYTYVARWMLPMARRSRINSVLSEIGRGTPLIGRGAVSDLEPGSDPQPFKLHTNIGGVDF